MKVQEIFEAFKPSSETGSAWDVDDQKAAVGKEELSSHRKARIAHRKKVETSADANRKATKQWKKEEKRSGRMRTKSGHSSKKQAKD